MNLSLRNILIGAVSLLIVLIAAGGVSSLFGLNAIQHNVVNMGTNWLPSVNVVNAINTNTSDLRVAEGAHVLSTTPEGMTKAEADFDATLATLKRNQATYEPLISSEEERQTYNAFKDKFAQYMQLHDQLFALSRQNRNDEAAALFKGQMRTVYDAFTHDLDKDVQINIDGANKDFKASSVQYNQVKTSAFAILAVSLLVGGAAVFVILTGVIKPLRRTTDVMARVSQGQLDTDIPYSGVKNEIGDMARTLVVFRDGLREAKALREASERQKAEAEAQRRADMLKLADDFEQSVGGIVTLVSAAATEMQASAVQLSATAQEASAQSVAVSAAAEEAGANVTSVAASTEELGASVSEIGRQVEASASIATHAVREAEGAQALVSELNETAGSIGSVVDLIAGLANQTNLLALNATIESARAGEAGRGFAVVASEVKALAGQTARATTEISAKIGQIQDVTAKAAAAMRTIAGTIQDINHSSSAIASAVEQQSAATQEIIQSVNQASIGAQEVTSNISGVAQAAEQTGEASAQVRSASAELANQAERLHNEMDRFLANVRAA